jgi:hypothetical protein
MTTDAEALHELAQAAAELDTIFEARVEAALERYDMDPAYHRRVRAIADVLAKDPLMDTLHPDVRSSSCARLALRMVVADDIILSHHSAGGRL